MSERIVFDHDNVDRFIAGTVGPPGERAFFLQVSSEIGTTTVSVEKSQVEALAERMHELVGEVRRNSLASLDEIEATAIRDDEPLEFPIDEDFRAGVIGIAWDQLGERVSIEIQAITDLEIDELLDDEDLSEIEDAPDLLQIRIRLGQAKGFIDRSRKLVSSGRQPCPFCSLPLSSDGHLCPRANGYRR